MTTYAAFLGHQPLISLAELSAALPDFALEKMVGTHVALFSTNESLGQEFFDTIGGTVVLAEQMPIEGVTLEDIPKVLFNEIGKKRGKSTFSLRTMGIPGPAVRLLYKRSKQKFRAEHKPCRYVGSERKPALPVLLHDTGMLEGKGSMELVLLQIGEEEDIRLWIGRTVAAQNVDKYTHRDMEKPVRDTGVGLLPPKLAQVLLNLGTFLVRNKRGAPPPSKRKQAFTITVLDPFCGTGVIPMECLLRGWPILASDISLKAVNGCTKNIEWIRKEEKILKKDAASTVWKQDAAKPFSLPSAALRTGKNLPDVIVTETSLGPPLLRRPTMKDVSKMKTESEKLQAAFLENAAKTLPGVPIVCAWPAWHQKGGWVRLEKIWTVLEKLGYTPTLPPGVEPETPDRVSLFYRRNDQFVGREIVLLMPPESE
ncbi:MAG: hypothetical protein WCX61_03765 [Candidatus Peribacteraceae bacterium]